MNVPADMFAALATAIYAEDLSAAREQLDLMLAVSVGEGAEIIIRARRTIYPLPAPKPLAEPLVLPAPVGVHHRSYFGGPAADSPRIRSYGA